MDPGVIGVFIPVVAIIAIAAIKIARIVASQPQAPSGDVTARLEALEKDVDGLQQQLTETQERLDFTERVLSQAREGGRLGG